MQYCSVEQKFTVDGINKQSSKKCLLKVKVYTPIGVLLKTLRQSRRGV